MLKKLSLGNVAARVTGAVISSTGSQITYTTEDPHNLYEGARVTVVGLATNTGANIVNGIISQIPSSVTMIVNPTTAISSPGTQPTGTGTLYSVNGAGANVKLLYAQPVVVNRPTTYNFIIPTISVVSNGTASNTITLNYSGVANPSALTQKLVRGSTNIPITANPITDNGPFTSGSTVSYTYTVSNSAGSVSASTSVIVLYINTPTGVTATSTPSTKNNITINWTAPTSNTPITSYTLLRSIDNFTFTTLTTVISSAAISTTDTPVVPGTTYYYKVQAIGTNASSPTSTASNGATPYYINDPTSFTATATPSTLNSVSLSWTAPSGSYPSSNVSYTIQRASSTNNVNFGSWSTLGLPTTSTSYVDTTVANETYYKYQIQANNGQVTSSFVTSSSVLPNYLTTPNTPTVNYVSTSTSALVISGSYTGNPAVSTTYLQRSSNSGTNWTTIATGSSATLSYTDANVSQNVSYVYRVQAQNSIATSAYSAASTSIKTYSIPLLPSPMITSVTPVAGTSDQLLISWNSATVNNAITPIASYTLQRATDSLFTTNLVTLSTVISPSANTYTDTERTIGTTYYYRMTATNSIGTTGYSNTGSGTIVLVNGTATTTVTTSTAYYNSTVSLYATTDIVAGGRSVQFQVSTDNSSWSNLGSAQTSNATTGTTPTITSSVTNNAGTTLYYRAVVAQDNKYLLTTSNTVTKTVTANPPNITGAVSTTVINIGSSVTLSANLKDVSGANVASEVVGWQASTDGSSWSNITTATTNASGNAAYVWTPGSSSWNYVRAYHSSSTNYAADNGSTIAFNIRAKYTVTTVAAKANDFKYYAKNATNGQVASTWTAPTISGAVNLTVTGIALSIAGRTGYVAPTVAAGLWTGAGAGTLLANSNNVTLSNKADGEATLVSFDFTSDLAVSQGSTYFVGFWRNQGTFNMYTQYDLDTSSSLTTKYDSSTTSSITTFTGSSVNTSESLIYTVTYYYYK
jgi:hypothetical protein